MNEVTLLLSCSEQYGYLKNIPAAQVFAYLQNSQLLDVLLDTYRQFPDMTLDFYLGMLDGMFSLETDAPGEAAQAPDWQAAASAVSAFAKAADLSAAEACRFYYETALPALGSAPSADALLTAYRKHH